MAWQPPRTNWQAGDIPAPADFNRIEGNTAVVREQAQLPIRYEVVSAFPAHAIGRVVFHTGQSRAFVSDGTAWIDISGAIGNAVAADVLAGQTFSSVAAGPGATGIMPNRPGHVDALSCSILGTTLRFRPPNGHYTGDVDNSVQMSSPGFTAANIRSGVDIFGITGTHGLRNVQFGITPITTAVQDIPIAAVDLSRTFLFAVVAGQTFPARIHLSSSTNINCDAGMSFSAYDLAWYVVEFNEGVSVQRGLTAIPLADPSVSVPITAVNRARSFALAHGCQTSGTIDFRQSLLSARLPSDTMIVIFRTPFAAGEVSCAWQVVSFT